MKYLVMLMLTIVFKLLLYTKLRSLFTFTCRTMVIVLD